MPKIKTQKEVIGDFKLIHQDTYDYSKVVYTSSVAKVTIICKTHGPFEQTPNSHKSGSGCPTCSNMIGREPLHGVGINDADYVTRYVDKRGNHIVCPYYSKWYNMLKRCYSHKYHIKHPTYIGCTVSKEWLLFSTFKKWMEKQDHIDKVLNKDILVEGNKVYSKDTCCFVSSAINSLLVDLKPAADKYPVGVTLHKPSGKYRGTIYINGKNKHLGSFYTIEEASYRYNLAKSKYIIEKANELTDTRVKEGLLRIAKNKLNT